jgi:hypothetical protein
MKTAIYFAPTTLSTEGFQNNGSAHQAQQHEKPWSVLIFHMKIAIDIAHKIAISLDTQKQNGRDLHRARFSF